MAMAVNIIGRRLIGISNILRHRGKVVRARINHGAPVCYVFENMNSRRIEARNVLPIYYETESTGILIFDNPYAPIRLTWGRIIAAGQSQRNRRYRGRNKKSR